MAHYTTHPTSSANPIWGSLSAVFSAFGTWLVTLGEANSKMRQAEALHALSDAELAQRGLKREDIARYVFADAHWV